jgi:hypothetical protein
MAKFAAGTEVPPERSRAEIEGIVRRYGAGQFMSGYSEDRALIGFSMHGRQVKFVIKIPPVEEFALTERGVKRSAQQMVVARHAEERRRWRCLALSIKAKLEAVESEIVTFWRTSSCLMGARWARVCRRALRWRTRRGRCRRCCRTFRGGELGKG